MCSEDQGKSLKQPQETEKTRYSPIWALAQVVLFVLIFMCFLRVVQEIIGLMRPDISALGAYWKCVSEAISLLIGVIVIAILKRKKTFQFFQQMGLTKPKYAVELIYGFLLGSLLVGTMFGVMYVLGGYTIESVQWPIDFLPGLLMFLLVGFAEELIFRGYVFQALERGIGPFFAVIISSLLFGFAHSLNQIENVSLMEKIYFCAVLSFEAGLPLAGAYLLTRRIWLPIGFHWAWDFLEGTIFGFTVSGTDIGPSVMTTKLTGDLFTSGGAFGPEASLPAFFIGVACGAVLLYWTYRKGMWQTEHPEGSTPK